MITDSSHGIERGYVDSINNTNWTGQIDPARFMGASLNRLVESYRIKVVRRAEAKWKRSLGDEMDDLVQSFLLKMIEGRVVRHADRERGRFRHFVLKSFDNHVLDWLRKSKPQTLNDDLPEIFDELQAVFSRDLDRFCAHEILLLAGAKLQQRCQLNGDLDSWRLAEEQLIKPILERRDPLSQSEVCQKYGLASNGAVSGRLRTLRKWFQECVREVIEGYTSSADELEREFADFVQALPQACSCPQDVDVVAAALYSDISCYLPPPPPASGRGEWDGLRTFADVICHCSPPLQFLIGIKSFAKAQLRQRDPQVPIVVAKTLYFFSIAMAQSKLGSLSFSTLPTAEVRNSLYSLAHEVCSVPEIADRLRELASQVSVGDD